MLCSQPPLQQHSEPDKGLPKRTWQACAVSVPIPFSSRDPLLAEHASSYQSCVSSFVSLTLLRLATKMDPEGGLEPPPPVFN